jgi:opacity protein-like surface antigen
METQKQKRTMKKFILPLVMVGVVAAPSLARAVTKPYVGVTGGVGLLNDSKVDGNDDAIRYNTGYLINGAVGLKQEAMRYEFEAGYHRNSVDSADYSIARGAHVSMWSFMANGYYDFGPMSTVGLTPYVMAGLGMVDASISDGNWGGASTAREFAWQLGAGIGIKTSPITTLDIGYRYLSPSDARFDGYKVSLASSNFLVGIRYSF